MTTADCKLDILYEAHGGSLEQRKNCERYLRRGSMCYMTFACGATYARVSKGKASINDPFFFAKYDRTPSAIRDFKGCGTDTCTAPTQYYCEECRSAENAMLMSLCTEANSIEYTKHIITVDEFNFDDPFE